nr:hypothetical protein [uncultured Cohaesibacter sp.]
MTWCAWAKQNGHSEYAEKYLSFSRRAESKNGNFAFTINPWLLETLVNEALVRVSICDKSGFSSPNAHADVIYNLSELIRFIEEADDQRFLSNNNVLYEMHRLSQRQFEWQRGFANQPRFYRSLRLFGKGEVGEYFENSVGCSVPDFMEAAFYIYLGQSNSPSRNWASYREVGDICSEKVLNVLNHISLPSYRAITCSRKLRAGDQPIAYKPSILRQYPILRFETANCDAMSPLPSLILNRATSELYLDIVEGGGSVWSKIGKNFERYCEDYLRAMLDGFEVKPEFRYGTKKNPIDTPDILVYKNQTIRLVIECKAKRMPIDARYSSDPVAAQQKAYEEIAKGIFQIWRFRSCVRRNCFTQPVHEDCLGIVVTTNPWLIMGMKLYPEVIAIAKRIVEEKDPQIGTCDQGRVPIVHVDDLEYHLQHGTTESFLERLKEIAEDDSGWKWSLNRDINAGGVIRPYPFSDELTDSLPRIFGDRKL